MFTPPSPTGLPTTATLAIKLAAIYRGLQPGTDYTLSADGTAIATWKPRQTSLKEPTLAMVDSAYAAMLTQREAAAKISAALAALGAFWGSLTPEQQMPMLVQKSTIKDTIASDTHATVLLIEDLANGVTGLTPAQTVLKTAALAACAALIA